MTSNNGQVPLIETRSMSLRNQTTNQNLDFHLDRLADEARRTSYIPHEVNGTDDQAPLPTHTQDDTATHTHIQRRYLPNSGVEDISGYNQEQTDDYIRRMSAEALRQEKENEARQELHQKRKEDELCEKITE
eukprot:GHVR01048657.1.p1 GENE.GHVR01048657.1~~GHVR01048657.1.p1  ORF type:complete len:132 (+),score=13.87 GHVR01048657.1:1192-1587(+)